MIDKIVQFVVSLKKKIWIGARKLRVLTFFLWHYYNLHRHGNYPEYILPYVEVKLIIIKYVESTTSPFN